MPNILSIPDIIEIGDVSIYLSGNYSSKGAIYRPTVVKPTPPIQIAMVTDALRWGYDNNSGAQIAESLRSTANYAYWLYGLFQLQAQYILNGAGGGSVVPTPSGGGNPNDIDFIVSDTSIIATGDSYIYLDGTNGNPDLRGYDIEFFRSGQPNYTTPQAGGAVYYYWNSLTGLLQLLPDPGGEATEGEPMRISPKTGGGTSVMPASSVYPLFITSANFEPDGVSYNNQAIVGDELSLFVNNFASNILYAPDDFVYTATGIQIVALGFDANTFNYKIQIQKINS